MTERIRLGVPIIVLALLVLLAAGISQVSFVGTRYGPPSEPTEEPSGTLHTSPQEGQGLAPLIEQIIAVTALGLILFAMVVSVLRPKSLWEALKRALPAALWFAAILLILLRWRDRPFFREPKDAPAGVGTAPAAPDQPFPTLEQVHVPSWVTFLFVLGALLLIGVTIFVAWRLWRARTRTTPIEELADLTRRYAQELRYGAPVHETILRCYREMCQLLSERFHLEISRAMTAREFERRLAQIGVLEEHIVRMSRLFEWARYSPARPSPEHEHEALQLLEEIARIYGRERGEVPHPA
jgi:Na+-transporting methylmalonyl-CoA/oxaloacetate decarboxylase gamma subunit